MTGDAALSVLHRITLVLADADEEAQAAGKLILDLAVDAETGLSSGPFPAFGRKGDFRQPDTLLPFTLMADGRLDFGAFAPAAERADVLNIRRIRLVRDEDVICTTAGGDTRYRILSIAPTAA